MMSLAMKTLRPKHLGLIALCVVASPVYATEIKPGLWEFRSTQLSLGGLPDLSAQLGQLQQQLKNLPPETRRMIEQQMAERGVSVGQDGTVRSCITPEQAKQDHIYSGKTEGECTLHGVSKTASTVSGQLNCPAQQATGDFAARIDSPERFTTRVKLQSPRGNMQLATEARWVSAQCETRN
jgi:hypothetical protein